MTSSEAPDASDVEFDPFSPTYFDDPYETYRQLRDHRPVYLNDTYGFAALSRWDDVVEAHKNWRAFSSEYGVDLATLTSGRRPDYESLIMIDPPRHDRLRALVSRVFTPRAISALEPMIREVITGYLDELDPSDEMDARRRLRGSVPRRDHLEDARRAGAGPPADPPLARLDAHPGDR